MNLDRTTVNIRPRTSYEAVDLGFILAREWYWQLLPFAILVLPCLLILLLPVAIVLPGDTGSWLFFLFWFHKPFVEPFQTSWLSRAVFGEKRSSWQTVRSLFHENIFGLLTSLLFCRLNPYRAFALPVTVLEGLTGTEKRERVKILAGTSGTPLLLLFFCFTAEMVVTLSFISFIFWLIPEDLRLVNLGDFIFSPDSVVLLTGYLIIAILLSPFVTSANFLLYLSRRVELEAWDIELGFKRIRNRLSQLQNSASKQKILIVVFIFTSLISTTGIGHADNSPEPDASGKRIETILDQPEFGTTITEHRWVLKPQQSEVKESSWQEFFDALVSYLADPLKSFQEYLATYGEITLWFMFVMLIGFILLRLHVVRQWLSRYTPAFQAHKRQPSRLFGLDLTPQSLPDDLPGTCRELLEEGRQREALSLLYRGTLSLLLNNFQVPVTSSFTENECCLAVKDSRPAPEYSFFAKLTRAWILLAYGHHTLDSRACLEMIGEYQLHYGEKK